MNLTEENRKAFPSGEGGGRRPTERVSKVGRDYSQDLLWRRKDVSHTPSSAVTIVRIGHSYLRHPLHRSRGPPSPGGRGCCIATIGNRTKRLRSCDQSIFNMLLHRSPQSFSARCRACTSTRSSSGCAAASCSRRRTGRSACCSRSTSSACPGGSRCSSL